LLLHALTAVQEQHNAARPFAVKLRQENRAEEKEQEQRQRRKTETGHDRTSEPADLGAFEPIDVDDHRREREQEQGRHKPRQQATEAQLRRIQAGVFRRLDGQEFA
jgi:hypothetical protein